MRLPLIRLRFLSFAGFAVLLLGVDTGAASRAQAETCFGAAATIVGTEDRDDIQGTSGPDVIVSLDGRDIVDGGDGNDLVCSGDEIDEVHGGAGSDRIDGGGSFDQLYGDAGDDVVDGGAGDDFDVLAGAAGNDTLNGKRPGDFLSDKAEYDTASGPVRVDLVEGVATGEGTDRLVGIDWVEGSAFADVLIGSDADNLIDGSGGDDRIEGGSGGDILSGAGSGSGVLADIDLVNYSASPGAVRVDLGAGRATGWGNDTVSGVEGSFGSDFNDTLVGNAGDNRFWGLGGNDELRGLGGDDRALFDNAVDADLTRGRAVGDGTDRLIAIEGLQGSGGDDRLVGDKAANFLSGGFGGNDVLAGGAGPDVLLAGGPSTLTGGDGDDLLSGWTWDDRLTGGGGKDAFFGGAGNDTLRGGSGDDLLTGDGGNDTIDGGVGTGDTVSYTFGGAAVRVDLVQGSASGVGTDRLGSIEGVFGSSGDDEILGDARANSLSGGAGDDRISGGAGADFLDGGGGSDDLTPGAGSDYCLESGRGCEIAGVPRIPGAAPRPPGVQPPPLRPLRVRPRPLLRTGADRLPGVYVLALRAAGFQPLGPARVARGETAGFKYAAEPVCFARKPYRTEIAPPRTVSPIAGDGRPEEAWWQGTLYRASGRGYRKFRTTAWARAALAGGATVPGVTLWKDQTGKRAFPNVVVVRAKPGRYVWKGNIYWVRSGGQVFQPIEPHIIRARTITHDMQCVFR